MRLVKQSNKQEKNAELVPNASIENITAASQPEKPRIKVENLIPSFKRGYLITDDNRYMDNSHIRFDIKD